jgi:hypothetical protein
MRIHIPEVVVEGKRLGRNIHHDPESRRYRVARQAEPTTATHRRMIPILDQGNLGSCTGNATVGCLGSEPFYDTLSPDQQNHLNEDKAVEIYSLATQLDAFGGSYPPDDTGSDGLDVAKAAQQLGFIVGYQHILDLGDAYAKIIDCPFIFGGLWMDNMDRPDGDGVVHCTGAVRGGHEWLVRCYDAAAGMWLCDNSWGDGFGLNGSFKLSDTDFKIQLDNQADATAFTGLNKPAPTPVDPAQPDTPGMPDFPWDDVDPWRHSPHVWSKATRAAHAVNKYATAIGHE